MSLASFQIRESAHRSCTVLRIAMNHHLVEIQAILAYIEPEKIIRKIKPLKNRQKKS